MSLEFKGASWLKWEKRCPLVISERTPRSMHGQPDILGVTDSRYLYEIEVKRSLSDFRANAQKYHVRCRTGSCQHTAQLARQRGPKLFWFLVPPNLVDKVRLELPDYAGLLTADDVQVVSVVPAPPNKDSERLSIKECIKLMRCAGNHLITLMHHQFYFRGNRTPEWMDSTAMDQFMIEENERRKKFAAYGYSAPQFDYVNFQI